MFILSLQAYSKEQLQEMSLIEIAYEFLKSKKEAVAFKEIMDEITTLLELSEDEVKAKIAQFYTDLNIDGRFLGLGDNRWGLRVWYPIEQVEEEVVTIIKPKKKKVKKVKDEDDLDYDDLDEDDLEFDELDDYEEEDEEDLLEDEEDLLDVEDLDEEELEDDDLLEDDEEYELVDEELEEEDDLDEDEDDDL